MPDFVKSFGNIKKNCTGLILILEIFVYVRGYWDQLIYAGITRSKSRLPSWYLSVWVKKSIHLVKDDLLKYFTTQGKEWYWPIIRFELTITLLVDWLHVSKFPWVRKFSSIDATFKNHAQWDGDLVRTSFKHGHGNIVTTVSFFVFLSQNNFNNLFWIYSDVGKNRVSSVNKWW